MSDEHPLRTTFTTLLAHYGGQGWWPAESPFEVMVGAVLTQNTAWSNVERAINNLRTADCLAPESILACPTEHLASLIRPSGYFNVKARRLQNLCRWLLAEGGEPALRRRETMTLRRDLLALNGVGPETADDILLYAFERPVFVIDAYTRRIFARLGLAAGDEGYEVLRSHAEEVLQEETETMQELHALLVVHAKEHCRVRPRCSGCPLFNRCASAST